MHATKEQIQQEALSRAATGQALTNYPAIIRGFMEKGIPADDIRPRENVFTYHAWRALGRQVRRGEHGVKVVTFVSVDARARTARRPRKTAPTAARHAQDGRPAPLDGNGLPRLPDRPDSTLMPQGPACARRRRFDVGRFFAP